MKRFRIRLQTERSQLLNEHAFLQECPKDGVEAKIYWHYVQLTSAADSARQSIEKMQTDIACMREVFSRKISNLTQAEDALDAYLESAEVQAYSEDLADRFAATPGRVGPGALRGLKNAKKVFLAEKQNTLAKILRRVDERGIAPNYLAQRAMEEEARNKQFATLRTEDIDGCLQMAKKDIYRAANQEEIARFYEVYCCLDFDEKESDGNTCKRSKSV